MKVKSRKDIELQTIEHIDKEEDDKYKNMVNTRTQLIKNNIANQMTNEDTEKINDSEYKAPQKSNEQLIFELLKIEETLIDNFNSSNDKGERINLLNEHMPEIIQKYKILMLNPEFKALTYITNFKNMFDKQYFKNETLEVYNKHMDEITTKLKLTKPDEDKQLSTLKQISYNTDEGNKQIQNKLQSHLILNIQNMLIKNNNANISTKQKINNLLILMNSIDENFGDDDSDEFKTQLKTLIQSNINTLITSHDRPQTQTNIYEVDDDEQMSPKPIQPQQPTNPLNNVPKLDFTPSPKSASKSVPIPSLSQSTTSPSSPSISVPPQPDASIPKPEQQKESDKNDKDANVKKEQINYVLERTKQIAQIYIDIPEEEIKECYEELDKIDKFVSKELSDIGRENENEKGLEKISKLSNKIRNNIMQMEKNNYIAHEILNFHDDDEQVIYDHYKQRIKEIDIPALMTRTIRAKLISYSTQLKNKSMQRKSQSQSQRQNDSDNDSDIVDESEKSLDQIYQEIQKPNLSETDIAQLILQLEDIEKEGDMSADNKTMIKDIYSKFKLYKDNEKIFEKMFEGIYPPNTMQSFFTTKTNPNSVNKRHNSASLEKKQTMINKYDTFNKKIKTEYLYEQLKIRYDNWSAYIDKCRTSLTAVGKGIQQKKQHILYKLFDEYKKNKK